MTGELIEYLQPPEETFSGDTSPLTLTCTFRPHPQVCVRVRMCKCVRVLLSGLACLSENVSHVAERLTPVFHSHGTTVELTLYQQHLQKRLSVCNAPPLC